MALYKIVSFDLHWNYKGVVIPNDVVFYDAEQAVEYILVHKPADQRWLIEVELDVPV